MQGEPWTEPADVSEPPSAQSDAADWAGTVGMGILYCATPVLSFPLRGKVGMGVVSRTPFKLSQVQAG